MVKGELLEPAYPRPIVCIPSIVLQILLQSFFKSFLSKLSSKKSINLLLLQSDCVWEYQKSFLQIVLQSLFNQRFYFFSGCLLRRVSGYSSPPLALIPLLGQSEVFTGIVITVMNKRNKESSKSDFQGNNFKALVYDFMPNGSMDSWLHSIDHMLDLVQRINIIKDVACALEYLHCHCGNVVVHCDLKPSNILLDADMVAHVGDFGLSKILSLEEVSTANKSSSSIIRGTIGYAPPEYGLGNEVSTNGDIYSFGILLLEMLTRKKPVDPMFEEGLSLHSYAKSALADGFVLQIVDPVLRNENVNEQSLITLVKIGVQCSSESPQDRMDIETIVQELFSITVTTRS